MYPIRLHTCLNQEPKAYGLKLLGLMVGAVGLCFLWMVFTLSLGLIASMPSYIIGSWVSENWFKGRLHKWIYWNLPTEIFFRTKYIANSKFKSFI